MWPWEHAIYGYLLYSMYCRTIYREPPDGMGAVTVVVASILPDVIDKPLAWSAHVTSTGYGPGHSLFFVLPLVVVVSLVTRQFGRPRLGVAFSIGYLAHLPGDILFAYMGSGNLPSGIVLWPVRTYASADGVQGLFSETLRRVGEYRTELLTGDPAMYVKFQLLVTALTVVLWIADGLPPVRKSVTGTKGVIRWLKRYFGQSES